LKPFLTIITICPLLLFPTVNAAAPAPSPAPDLVPAAAFETGILEAQAALRDGINAWDSGALSRARELYLALLEAEKDRETELQYFLAVCDYHLAAYAMAEDKRDMVDRFTAEALENLEKVILARPEWGEPYALSATIMGYQIALHPDRAMELGMRLYTFFGKAEEKGPDDPRVHLLQGISLFYTPAMYGGGADKAIPHLEKAVDCFGREKVDDPYQPSWGYDEACTYLGIACAQQGRADQAAAWFEKALAFNPDFSLARHELAKLK
jgi:tetratricopeptide (TPR) repeat protein